MATPVIKNGVGQVDIEINQGATFDVTVTYKDSNLVVIDLTDYTARMQVKQKKSDTSATIDLTTANGGIVLGDALGTIQIVITAAVTAALTITRGVYDLELISAAGVVTRLMEGKVTVSTEVTNV